MREDNSDLIEIHPELNCASLPGPCFHKHAAKRFSKISVASAQRHLLRKRSPRLIRVMSLLGRVDSKTAASPHGHWLRDNLNFLFIISVQALFMVSCANTKGVVLSHDHTRPARLGFQLGNSFHKHRSFPNLNSANNQGLKVWLRPVLNGQVSSQCLWYSHVWLH